MEKQTELARQDSRIISELFQGDIPTADEMKHLFGGDKDSGGRSTLPIDYPIYVKED
ncbi:MAG: hypothetical protein PHW91_07415 [Bacteroidales bacterium]|jgi:hypothetical protein|nr:hypothetical protein [Bacteroidales bacterium]